MMEPINIPEWLAAQRERRGLSLQALSDALAEHGGKASKVAVWEWERGGGIDHANLAALAAVLDLSDEERLALYDAASRRGRSGEAA